MFALKYDQYGDPDVLTTGDLPEPHADAGQVRIRVRFSAVNPLDWKVRSGALKEVMPQTFPVIPGSEASGIVDEVGAGVADVQVGDEVFGIGSGTTAEFAVLDHFAKKPSQLDGKQAAGTPGSAETAARSLAAIDLQAGQTLLIDNASGSVGAATAQFAIADGLTVIGTASEANHDRLRSLGVTPVSYGPGLAERIAAAGVSKVDGAIDAAGPGGLQQLIDIVGNAAKVLSLTDPSAPSLGAQLSMTTFAFEGLQRAADMATQGRYTVAVDESFPFTKAADAHRRSEAGHLRGKLVLGLGD